MSSMSSTTALKSCYHMVAAISLYTCCCVSWFD